MDKTIGEFLFSKNTSALSKLNKVAESLYSQKQYALLIHIFYFCSRDNIPFADTHDFFVYVAKSFYYVGEYIKCFEILTNLITHTNCIDVYNNLEKYIYHSYAHTKKIKYINPSITKEELLPLTNMFTICIIHKEYNILSINNLYKTLESIKNTITDFSLADNIIVLYRITEMIEIDRKKNITHIQSLYPWLNIYMVKVNTEIHNKINAIETTYTFLIESGWVITRVLPYLRIYLNHPQSTFFLNSDWIDNIVHDKDGIKITRTNDPQKTINRTSSNTIGTVLIGSPPSPIYYYYYNADTILQNIDIKSIQPCIFNTLKYSTGVIYNNLLFLCGISSFFSSDI